MLGTAAHETLLEQAQLQEKQFLELKSLGCKLKGPLVCGEMDIVQRILQRAQAASLEDIVRQCFPNLRQAAGQGHLLQLAHNLCGDAPGLELFRAGIDAGEALGGRRVCLGRIHLGMHYVDAASIFLGLAEEYEGAARDKAVEVPFDAFEEDHFHSAGGVLYHYAQVLDIDEVAHYHLTLHLNICKVRPHLCDGRDARAVHVAEGVEMDKIVKSGDFQFPF